MAWAKLHTDILGDPKLMRAARKGARHLHFLPWLIAFAKAADDDGRLTVNGLPAEPEDIAPLVPGASPRMIGLCFEEATEIGVLVAESQGTLRFTQWEHRSGKPSDAPEAVRERVARHRAQKRVAPPLPESTGNAIPVTPSNATEVEKKRVEGDTEVEGEDVTPLRRQRDRCLAEIPAPYRPALEGAFRSAPNADAWAAELCALADGLRGNPAPTWEHLGLALHDLSALPGPKSLNALRAFARKARDGAGTLRGPPEALGDTAQIAAAVDAERERRDRVKAGGAR